MVVDFELEFNSNLKYLHLTSIVLQYIHGITESLLQLIRFLSNFRESNLIEEIELELGNISYNERIYNKGTVDWSTWAGVDCLLAGPSFKYLRKITIDTYSFGWEDSRRTRGEVVRWSPLLRERGILVVE